jgi:hypothetical protein
LAVPKLNFAVKTVLEGPKVFWACQKCAGTVLLVLKGRFQAKGREKNGKKGPVFNTQLRPFAQAKRRTHRGQRFAEP